MMARDDAPGGEAAGTQPTLDEWMEMLALGRFSGPLRDAGVESVEALARLSPADLEKSCSAAGMKPIQRRKVQKRLSLLDADNATVRVRDDLDHTAITQPHARREPEPEPELQPEPQPLPEQGRIDSTAQSAAGFHAEPPHQYLGTAVMPRLMRALSELEAVRPPDALEFIAEQLERASDDADEREPVPDREEASSGDGLLSMGKAIGRAPFLQYADAYFTSALLEAMVNLNRDRPPKAEACAAAAKELRSAAAKFSPPETALHGHLPLPLRRSAAEIAEKALPDGKGEQNGSVSEDDDQADELTNQAETTADIVQVDARRLEEALAVLKQDEEDLRRQQPSSAPTLPENLIGLDHEHTAHADTASRDGTVTSRAGSSPRRRPRSPPLVGREVPGELGILAHSNGVQTQGSLELTVVSGASDLETAHTRRKPRGLATDEGTFGHGKLDPS